MIATGNLDPERLFSRLGVPVAWMLASNGTTATIAFFLRWVRDASPSVLPAVIMTDRDQAQINALEAIYPESTVNLCIWHVLRAMRSHINTNDHPELWDKVKALVKATDDGAFATLWREISEDRSTPPAFIEYLRTNWFPITHKWSRVLRKGRSIYEEGDTNMLIEAYVIPHFWGEII
jgi:transposase-like protein